MDPWVSSESQMFVFFSLKIKMEVYFRGCEPLRSFSIGANVISLTTEWFPYHMTRKTLAKQAFYNDWSGVHVGDGNIQHPQSRLWGLSQHLDIQVNVFEMAFIPLHIPCSPLRNNCQDSAELRFRFLFCTSIWSPHQWNWIKVNRYICSYIGQVSCSIRSYSLRTRRNLTNHLIQYPHLAHETLRPRKMKREFAHF